MAGEGQPRAVRLVVTGDLLAGLNVSNCHIHEVADNRVVVAGMIDEALRALDLKELVSIQRV